MTMNTYAPKYVIIKNYIIEEIQNGNLKVGDQIPSENELTKLFNVSRVTANTAIRELSTLGIVERIQGRGTFVTTKEIQEHELYHETSKSIKISSELLESHLHHVEEVSLIEADKILASKLQLTLNDKVYRILRFMMRDGEVIGIDYSYIPLKYVGNNPDVDFQRLNSSYLHDFVSDILKIKLKSIHIHIDAKLPDEYEMEKIEVTEDYPLVIWDTNVLDSKGTVIAYTTTIADPKKYRAYINFDL